MIKIGEFYLDQDSNILYNSQHQEVRIESKTMQVLIYLLSNNERYVTLSELHDNLWEGRIVSDSAVRQTISKLRKLLKDNGDDSRIIRSVVKKGYRFIYPIQNIEQNIEQEQLKADIKTHKSKGKNSKSIHYHCIKRWVIRACLLLAILSILIFGGLSITQPLGLAAGINTGISFNKNGDVIYVTKSHHNDTYYKLMKHSGNSSEMLMKSKNALLFPLVTDSQEIWVGWQSIDKCGIYHISETGNITQPIALLDDACMTISHLSVQGNNILISAKADAKQPFKISIINTDDLSISNVSPSLKSHDPLMAAVSPHKKWLATVTQNSQQYILSIYNLKTNQRLGQWNYANAATQLRWHRNNIYISTAHNLGYIELKSLEKKSVLTSDSVGQFTRLIDFWIDDDKNYVLQEQQPLVNQRHLANYHISENNELAFHQSFYLGSGPTTFSGNSPRSTYYSQYNKDYYQIFNLDTADSIYTSDKKISVLNYDPNEANLLFTEGDDLVLLGINTMKVLSRININTPIQGVFKPPKQSIYWLITQSELGFQTLSWDYSANALTQIAVNEFARFMIGNDVAWLDANDRKIKIKVDKTITTISDSMPIYNHSQWQFSQESLWFTQNTPAGSRIFRTNEKNKWKTHEIFEAGSINHISIGQNNVYIQARKTKISELFNVTNVHF